MSAPSVQVRVQTMGPGSFVSEDDTHSTVSNDTAEEVTGFMKKFTALQALQQGSSPTEETQKGAAQMPSLEEDHDEDADLPESKFQALLNAQEEEDEMASLSGKQLFQKRFSKQRRTSNNNNNNNNNNRIRKPLTLPGQPQQPARLEEDGTISTGFASHDETILSALPQLVSPLSAASSTIVSTTSTLMTSSTFGRPMASSAAAQAALPPHQPRRRGTLDKNAAMAMAAAVVGEEDARSRLRSGGSTHLQGNPHSQRHGNVVGPSHSQLESDISTLGSHYMSSSTSNGDETTTVADKSSISSQQMPPLEGMTQDDADENDNSQEADDAQDDSDGDNISVSGMKLRQKKLRKEESKRRLLNNSHFIQTDAAEKRKRNPMVPARSSSPDEKDVKADNNNNYRNAAVPHRPVSPEATIEDDEESLSPILVKSTVPDMVPKSLKMHMSVPQLSHVQDQAEDDDDEVVSLSGKKLLEKKQRKEQHAINRRNIHTTQTRYGNFQMGSKAMSVSNLETMLHNLTDKDGRPPVIREHVAAVHNEASTADDHPTIKFERRRSEVSAVSGITWEFSEATSTVPSMASNEKIPSGMAAAAAAARRWDTGCPGAEDLVDDDDDDDDDDTEEDDEEDEDKEAAYTKAAAEWKVRTDNQTMVFNRTASAPTEESSTAHAELDSTSEGGEPDDSKNIDAMVSFLLGAEKDDAEKKSDMVVDSSTRSAPERGNQNKVNDDNSMKDRSEPGLLNLDDDEDNEIPTMFKSSDGTPDPVVMKEFVQSGGAVDKDKGKASDPRSFMKKFKKQMSFAKANKYLKFGGDKKKSAGEQGDHMMLVDGIDGGEEVSAGLKKSEESFSAMMKSSSHSEENDDLFRDVASSKSPVKAKASESNGMTSHSPLGGGRRQQLKKDNVGSMRKLMRFPFGRSSSVPNLLQDDETGEDETEKKNDHSWDLAHVHENSEDRTSTTEQSSANEKPNGEITRKTSKSMSHRKDTKQDTPPGSPSGKPRRSSSRKNDTMKRRHSGGGQYRKPSSPDEVSLSARRSLEKDQDSGRRPARKQSLPSSKAASSRRLIEKNRRSASVGRVKKSTSRSSVKSSSARGHDDRESQQEEEMHSSGEVTPSGRDRSSRKSKRSSLAAKSKPSSTRNIDDRSQSSRKSSRKSTRHNSLPGLSQLEEDDVLPPLPQDLVKGDDGRTSRSSRKSHSSSKRAREKKHHMSTSALLGVDEEVPRLPMDLVASEHRGTSTKKSIASKSTRRQSNLTKSRRSEADLETLPSDLVSGGRSSSRKGSRKSLGPKAVSARQLSSKSTTGGEDRRARRPERKRSSSLGRVASSIRKISSSRQLSMSERQHDDELDASRTRRPGKSSSRRQSTRAKA